MTDTAICYDQETVMKHLIFKAALKQNLLKYVFLDIYYCMILETCQH